MIQVNNLYESWVAQGRVPAICRFNLRKFCKAVNLPPCGVAFWLIDDLNWDYLADFQAALKLESCHFHGGEDFPRPFLDACVFGQTERSEFVFLLKSPQHHAMWRGFFETCFASCARHFGTMPALMPDPNSKAPLSQLRIRLLEDLIHFGREARHLSAIADFYMTLVLAGHLQVEASDRESLFEAFKTRHPEYRADLSRILNTTDVSERLDDLSHLLNKVCGIQCDI